jgi:DNA-binding NarL/FixJ family response regulator
MCLPAISFFSKMHSILIVDDHPIVREGLSQLIAAHPHFHICAQAGDWGGAISATAQHRPEVIVLDISLEKRIALDLTRELLAVSARSKVLVLSMHDEMIYAERAIKTGAHGYVMKANATERVLEAIQTVLRGEIYLSARIKDLMLKRTMIPKSRTGSAEIPELSNREVEVLKMIAEGLSSQEISERMCLSTKTIEVHRSNIRAKLRLEKGERLLEFAIRFTREIE